MAFLRNYTTENSVSNTSSIFSSAASMFSWTVSAIGSSTTGSSTLVSWIAFEKNYTIGRIMTQTSSIFSSACSIFSWTISSTFSSTTG